MLDGRCEKFIRSIIHKRNDYLTGTWREAPRSPLPIDIVDILEAMTDPDDPEAGYLFDTVMAERARRLAAKATRQGHRALPFL